jgi:hypothetical protein
MKKNQGSLTNQYKATNKNLEISNRKLIIKLMKENSRNIRINISLKMHYLAKKHIISSNILLKNIKKINKHKIILERKLILKITQIKNFVNKLMEQDKILITINMKMYKDILKNL